MTIPPNDRDVHTLRIIVLPQDIDDLDHVNNVVYLKWVQEVAAKHWEKVSSTALRSQCMWVVLRHEIDYFVPAIEGDNIEVLTWVDDPKGPRQNRYVSIQRAADQKVLAYAKSTWCLLDPATGKPKRISEEISNAFRLKEGI